MASVRDRLAAARTAAREDDRNGVKRQSGSSIGQNEAAGASPITTAVNDTTQRRNDAVDVRDRLASAREQARKADSTVRTGAGASQSPTVEKPDITKTEKQSNADRLAALREEKGRLEAGLDLDGAAALQPEISRLEKLAKYEDKSYDDTFTGQFMASMGQGRLAQEESYAYNRYLNDPTEENREKALQTTQVLKEFQERNREALADDATLPWISQSLAGYLPQFADQTKAQVGGGLAGGTLAGLVTGGVGTVKGAKAGAVAASGAYAYNTMSGAAFKSLLDLGVDEETARAAAKDEAVVSALIEMADTGLDIATLGVGKLLNSIGKGGVKALAKKGAGEAAETAARKFFSAIGKYALNIGGEYLEEGGQQAVSIANRERVKNGEGSGVLDLARRSVGTVWDAVRGANPDAAAEIHGAGVDGAKIAAMIGGATMAGTGLFQNQLNRIGETAPKTPQQDAGARIAQHETVDTAQQKAAAEAATGGNGQGTQTTTGDTLLDAIIKTMQPVTNRQAEALLNDPASAAKLGIDTNGMTKAQQRSAVKERVAQMQLEVPGEQIYDRGTDPLLQAIVGGISTGQDVENRNSFDSRSGTGYTENQENAALGGEQNGTQLDGAAGEGVRAEGAGAVGGREYAEGQGPIGQGDLSNPGVVLVNSETDKSGAKIGEASDKAAFSKLLSEARDSDPEHGWSVTPKTEQELADCRIFMREDGTAGLAVKSNGDIEAVFRNQKGAKGAMRSLIPMAIRNGGTKLDCYGKGLARLYGTFGFKPVCRVEFNPEYANPGWDQSKGTPYIYFMVATDTDADSVSRNIGKYGVITSEELDALPTFGKDGYDDADNYRNSLMESSIAPGTVGAAAAGFTQSDYGNLQLESSQFHSEGANAARPVDVPMYDGDGNPVSRFASNMMGAKAIPDDVIPMIQQMVADGELSYQARGNKNVRKQARASIREKGFDGAMEQLRAAVRDGKSDVNTIALGTELLVNAANAGDANAVAEVAALMQTSSTRVGQAMQYFTVLRKLNPSSQLYAIQKTVEQLNEKIEGRKAGRTRRESANGKKKSGSANGKENIPVSEWMTKAGELLAERLERSPGGQKVKAKTVVDTILNDLAKYAKDYMGRTESNRSARNYEQRLSDLMGNLPQYTQAVEAAKSRISQTYQNDPDMLSEFDEWMKKDVVSIFLSNETGKSVSVPQELLEKFLRQTDQEGRDAVMDEIYQNVANQVPPTWKDKWDAWRYMAMLTNPRTHIRNIVGNLGFQPVRIVKNEIAAGLERLFNVGEKTKAFAVSPAMYRAAWADYDNVGRLISGNRYSGVQNEIERRRRSFDSKALEAVSKGNSAALDFEDAVFKRITYADSLAGYLTANGVKAEQLDGGTVPAELLSRARDYAASEALKATYQDDNAVSRKAQEAGRVLGVVGDAILPFKKTPANILVRGFEYSPAGLAKALTADLVKVQRGEMSASQAIDSLASGLTGTGLFALGAYLFAQGLVTGAKGDDKEDKWAELLGHQGYALELPDGTSVTLDWLAPEALPFFMGVEFMSSVGESGWTGDEIVSALLDATKSVADPIIEMSMLQGVNDLIESVRYADGAPLSAMIPSIITSYLSQAVPTVLGQIERTSEPVRMTTYTDKNSKIPTDLQYAIGRVSARTPGLDFQQIPYIDAWGRTEESGDVLVRAVNNTLNPAYMSQVDVDNVEAELQRLYDATGEGGVFPSRAEKSFTVDGEEKYLSAEEYVKYAKDLGQSSYQLVLDGMATSAYKAMRDAEKVEYISDIYSYAKASAKANAGGNALEGWQKNAKTAQRDIGVSTVEYIALYQKYGHEILTGKAYDKTKEAVGAGLTVDQYASMRNGLDRDGNGSVSQEEAKEKLDSMDFSREQKDQLWTIINKTWKKNPYAS